MRTPALEVVGIPGIENAALVLDGDFELSRNHDAAFFAVMDEVNASGVAAGFIALLQDLQAATEQIVADLPIGDRLLAHLGQLFAAVEDLAPARRLQREEFGEPHRNAVEDALECPHRRIHLVGFDQRNRRIGDAGAFGEFALRQLLARPDESQPSTDIDAHVPGPCCKCCGSRKYGPAGLVKSMACRSSEKDLLRLSSRASGTRSAKERGPAPFIRFRPPPSPIRSGCRSRPTGSSRRRPACSPRPRACTPLPSTAAR